MLSEVFDSKCCNKPRHKNIIPEFSIGKKVPSGKYLALFYWWNVGNWIKAHSSIALLKSTITVVFTAFNLACTSCERGSDWIRITIFKFACPK